MKAFLIFILAIVLQCVVFVFNSALGAFIGWLCALIFGDVVADSCAAAGWPIICMWQIGMLIGFVDSLISKDNIVEKLQKVFN